MTEKKLALIDGYGFVFRAYHSLPPLTRSDGVPVGAVYGFTNMLIKLLASLNVSHVAVVFDSGSKTFRNDIYPQYKANRPPCPEDLIPQFAIVREAAESLNLAILEKTGVEADDIIATLAKKYAGDDMEVLIISSDKDLMQLVGQHVKMYDAMKNKMIGDKEVHEKFAVMPNRVLDVLALMGDASDNIPGVKGIGPKTAAELIAQFGDLENIFVNLDQIKQEKRRQLLADGVEKAKLSKILLSLKEDVEMGIELSDLEIQAINPHKLADFLEKQGFRSLVERVKKEFAIGHVGVVADAGLSAAGRALGGGFDGAKNDRFSGSGAGVAAGNTGEASSHVPQPSKPEIISEDFAKIKKTLIESKEHFAAIKKQIHSNGVVIIDYETQDENITSLTLSTLEDNLLSEVFYTEINLAGAKSESLDLFNFASEPLSSKALTLDDLEDILFDASVKKIFFDAKNFMRKIFIHKPQASQIEAFEDVSLINHLLNSSIKNDFRALIDLNLNEDIEARGFGKIFEMLDKSKVPEEFKDEAKKIEFFAFKNFALWQIYKILSPKIISEKLNSSYQNYEKPLLPVLASIEAVGVMIDTKKLHDLSQEFGGKILTLSDEIYKLAGQEFNIASPKQLGEILFEKMKLESSKKSKKTGVLSTNSEVLEELAAQGFEIADKILEFRKLTKLKNTYTDALPKEINEKTGRIHTHLSSISTVTGRLSSSAPNLQNIPIKSAEGQKIRQSFIAKKGCLLISVDYSQIELRVIAHMAQIENLIQAFKENKDIHRITAAQVFGLKEEDVTDEIRSKAKAINFGIIYGISGFGLARQLGISRKDASDYIKSYLAAYPGIDLYMKNYIDIARKNGFVQTITGRKCFIRSINDKNPMIRQEAERLAINAPVQGSAADIIKKAMIRVDKKIRDEKLPAKITLQIHDELLIEADESKAEEIAQIVKSEMENAFTFDVSLKVDIKIAKFWD